jgi:hypothetical protein
MAILVTDNSLPAGEGLTFEKVWTMFQETGKQIKDNLESIKELRESHKEFRESQNELRESQKETAKQMKETDRQIQDYNKRFGEFTRRFGDIVEYMIAPNLRDKFKEYGFIFPKANNNTRVNDHENDIHFEIDVMLENGEKAMLVEIKTKLTTENVKDHIERLEKMRTYADLHGDKRSFLGAVAGVVMDTQTKNFALKQGLFAVEPSGESFNITPPPGQPREW